MKRIALLWCLLVMTVAGSFGQRMVYPVIATSTRDMQTERFGKVHPVKMTIVRDGNSAVTINGATYKVIRVDRRTDTDSLSTIQYTAMNSNGKEFVIKFAHELTNKVELMRYQVMVMDTAAPYSWTYYFTDPPRTALPPAR